MQATASAAEALSELGYDVVGYFAPRMSNADLITAYWKLVKREECGPEEAVGVLVKNRRAFDAVRSKGNIRSFGELSKLLVY